MANLRFEGSLTVVAAADIHGRLAEAFSGGDEVLVDCSGVEEADVAALQLLVAAGLAARHSGTTLRFEPPPSPALAAAFELAGLALPF